MRVTDQPLYDFGFAQFYRALANATNLPLTSYKSRGMMMLRDDYIALSDEMEDNTKQGQFAWSTAWDFPQIYQLKPGIADYTTEDLQQVKKGRAMGMKTVVRRYKGAGDFLTVVAPTPVNAQAQPYGALVNGEYVFMSDGSQSYAQGTVRFQGTAGYARKNQLALFEGTEIGLDGFLLQRSGGDFGVSADASQRFITGRIVGRDGGQILMTPPAGFDATKARVQIDGKAVQSTIVKGAISFPVTIALSDGAKSYRIDFGG